MIKIHRYRGIDILAKMVRTARGDLSRKEFEKLTGVLESKIWEIESSYCTDIKFPLLQLLAPHIDKGRYSAEELADIVHIPKRSVVDRQPSLDQMPQPQLETDSSFNEIADILSKQPDCISKALLQSFITELAVIAQAYEKGIGTTEQLIQLNASESLQSLTNQNLDLKSLVFDLEKLKATVEIIDGLRKGLIDVTKFVAVCKPLSFRYGGKRQGNLFPVNKLY